MVEQMDVAQPQGIPKLYIGRIKLTPELIEEIEKNGGKLTGNVKDIIEMDAQYNNLLTIRGKAIDISLIIERTLEYLITSLLFENQVNRKPEAKFFENFIVNTNHLTFASKLKIFRSLYKTCSYLQMKESECIDVATKIQKVIETRDNFAHGEVFFKDIKPPVVPYLFYYRENEPREQKLDEEYFASANALFQQCAQGLVSLRDHINGCFEKKEEIKWKL